MVGHAAGQVIGTTPQFNGRGRRIDSVTLVAGRSRDPDVFTGLSGGDESPSESESSKRRRSARHDFIAALSLATAKRRPDVERCRNARPNRRGRTNNVLLGGEVGRPMSDRGQQLFALTGGKS